MKALLRIVAMLAGLAAVSGLSACHQQDRQVAAAPAAPAADAVETGRYLALAGDCVACHTRPGGADYAGGRAIVTPYGSIYSTNLTPDADTGLGSWSADDFWQALHNGRSKTLGLLYPAFPFTNFTRLSRGDSDAIFAYLKSLPPVRSATPPAQMRFPFGQRWLMGIWRALYFKPGSYQPDPAQSPSWNRGAYLVQGLGHCDACHSERNWLGAVKPSTALHGGVMAGADWYAPAIAGRRGAAADPQGAAELPQLLRSGLSDHGVAVGPMASVVYYSLQHLSAADAQAIADYLDALPSTAARAPEEARLLSAGEASRLAQRGKALYVKHCQDCHAADGSGRPPAYPALAGNPAVLESVANPVRVIANGGFPPGTQGNPRPYGMPAFIGDLSDEDMAAVLTYVRRSWGNNAAPVSPVEVEQYKVLPSW
jgi:mono/diheme cytochrome c family protein